MATELLQPGVSVIQEFRSVSPTIVTPTLVPCVIAPAFQVLNVMIPDATGNQVVNSKAVASVPAILMATLPAPYTSLDGKILSISINNGPAQEITFVATAGASLDAGQVKDQISAAAPDGFGAYVISRSGSEYVQLRTTAVGDGQSLKVLNGNANATFGFADNYLVEGTASYKQASIRLEQANFPDPRALGDEMDIDESSIRVFVNTGKSLKELSKTETFLRRKKQAKLTSTTISFPVVITSTAKRIAFQEGYQGAVQEFNIAEASYANASTLATAINNAIGGTKVAGTSGNTFITFTSSEGYIEVLAPTTNSANALIGWATGATAYTLEAVDDGDGDTKTPIVVADMDNFTAAAGAASVTGSLAISTALAIHNKTVQIAKDGKSLQEIAIDAGPIIPPGNYTGTDIDAKTLSFVVNEVPLTVTFVTPATIDAAITQINAAAGTTVAYKSASKVYWQVGGATPVAGSHIVVSYTGAGDNTVFDALGLTVHTAQDQTVTLNEVVTLINATMGSGFASNVSTYLKLTSSTLGSESSIYVGKGTANSYLGLTDESTVYGTPFVPKVGDEIWADGVLLGKVAMNAPGAFVNRIKLDREIATDFGAQAFYIEAKAIPSSLPADRPTPDLVIDPSGSALIKQDILRDIEGSPIVGGGSLLVAYKALRLDVTSVAHTPSLLTFSDLITLYDTLEPVSSDNPLALMLYFMMVNAPGVSVAAIGVDGTSALDTDGTPEAYAKALSFLEAQEVYAMAPASQNTAVHQACISHATAMSQPDSKGERIVLFNPAMPDEDLPVLVASGDGDSTSTTNQFDTTQAAIAAALLAAGVDPVGTIPVSSGVYLTVASSAYKWSVSQVSGTKLTLRVAFAPGENDDTFYATSNLSGSLIAVGFTLYIRGTALVTPTGDVDYQRVAEAYQKIGQSYLNRRAVMVAPERVGAIVDGSEQALKGYYACSAIAGMIGQLPPQQGFTNYPIGGFTRVMGSNDVFTRKQMNIGAAGGTYWVVQETAGAPLTTRHQLTTDMTSIETRELSITKVVDFMAKMMREGLRSFIGRFNITQTFLDSLGTVVQGQLGFAIENGILVGGDLNNIVQDESAPDSVLIDVTLDPPFPCNYLRLTLVL